MKTEIYTAETGILDRKYVARVLRDGVLAWQSKRLYLCQLKALNAAQKKCDRMAAVIDVQS